MTRTRSSAASSPVTPPHSRTAIRLGRGVWIYEAGGKVAYLGTIITVIDSKGRDTQLSCHCPLRDVAEVVARLWDRLHAVDPEPAR